MPKQSLRLDDAVDLTRTGDVWLFRGRKAADRAIQVGTNSPVNHVGMAVVVEDRLATVRVVDDGTGVGPHDEGMGIPGMRSRVEALGGILLARYRPGGGFEVVAELPL